ncbi:MAG: nucleotidyl transferase AbiEii/AbiGii toxin family protein [Parafilimonas sp.]
MLYQNAVPPAALELLKTICAIKELELFSLGGGTSLALRMNHRLSIDLDFFTNTNFKTDLVLQIITKKFASAELLFEQNQTMMFSINNVKVDFVLYPFPWLQPFDFIEGTRLLSIEDIIPMKLQAASNRNAKKDYWDIAALLKNFSLDEMLKIFTSKFPQVDIGFIIHSLTDFEKADTEPDPDATNKITWENVKDQLVNAVKQYTMKLL